MLVAFEGGSMFRAFLSLLTTPLAYSLVSGPVDHETGLRVMIFATFCGLPLKDAASVGRAVLPKFFLRDIDINLMVFEAWASARRKVVLTSVPKVMVKGFFKEYLMADDVAGTKLQILGGYFTGFPTSSGLLAKPNALNEVLGDQMGPDVVGIGSECNLHDPVFLSLCKEAYVVTNEDRMAGTRTIMQRDEYPKPLIFHYGRLAFLPTPAATLAMFLRLPLGLTLAIVRLLVGIGLLVRMTRRARGSVHVPLPKPFPGHLKKGKGDSSGFHLPQDSAPKIHTWSKVTYSLSKRAVYVEVQPLDRGIDGRDRSSGDGWEWEHVLRHDGKGVQVHGSHLLFHESTAHLLGAGSWDVARGANLRWGFATSDVANLVQSLLALGFVCTRLTRHY
ncbi:hypothetical protein ACLOJK_010930 [Asimina triloba]